VTTSDTCPIRELVGGSIELPSDELDAVLTDPDSGEDLFAQRASSTESVERAIATAWQVHTDGTWAHLPAAERAEALRALQRELVARAEDIGRGDSLGSGVPVATTSALTAGTAVLLDVAATRVESGFGHEEGSSSAGPTDQWRLPWGPAAVFLPWNAPAPTAIVKMSEALVAGCPVVIKPSEWAPHFSGAFAEAVAASLPDGLVQVLHGDRHVGASIVADERIAAVCYTGGVEGGRAVAEACARQLKPANLELSGNNPVVVLADADPATVVDEVIGGMLFLNGQYCAGPRRLIVHEDQAADYVRRFSTALETVTIAATTDPASQLGPLSNRPHLERIEAQVAAFADRGCEVRRHGQLPTAGGHFAQPTVILADRGAEIRDEIFGPVLLVRTYRDLDEAVTVANDHPYGLSGHVFSARRGAARDVGRQLRAAFVKVNHVMSAPADISPVGSYWGVSGLGSLGHGEGAQFFSGARFVG
jgi:acyl-CoA reductase-like NAD-dependent aldehyde dehydrogenase